MARRRRNPQGQENSSSQRYHRSSRKERPVQRNAANARERARMRVLSKAFSRLKTSLPWVPADTKLSKLDTLRLASSYISHLRKVLAEDDSQQGAFHPINFTWPFTFGSTSSRSMEASSPTDDLDGDGDELLGEEEDADGNESTAGSRHPRPKESLESSSYVHEVAANDILSMNNHFAQLAHHGDPYDDYARINPYQQHGPLQRNNIQTVSY